MLPKDTRQKFDIKRGEPIVFIFEGDAVRMLPKPESYASYTRGLGKEMWAKLGGGERFLRKERASWG